MSSETASGGARQTRVAVDVLQRDQRVVLWDGDQTREPSISPLFDGFDSRRAAINWWQAAAVRTFGYLAEVFPARKLVADKHLAKSLYGNADERGHIRTRERALEVATNACKTAHRDCEQQANEWIADAESDDDDWTDIDPERQKHVAMRPAFSRLDDEQARCLRELWNGFPDRQRVVRWTHTLPTVADFEPVFEELDLNGDSITDLVVQDRNALRSLIKDHREAHDWRERWAATILLPAFAQRAQKLQAAERPDKKPTDTAPVPSM